MHSHSKKKTKANKLCIFNNTFMPFLQSQKRSNLNNLQNSMQKKLASSPFFQDSQKFFWVAEKIQDSRLFTPEDENEEFHDDENEVTSENFDDLDSYSNSTLNLDNNLQMTTSQEFFTCPYEDCEFSTHQRSKMELHISINHECHKCEECGAKFVSKRLMNYHFDEIHNPLALFSKNKKTIHCLIEECSLLFETWKEMLQHCANVHFYCYFFKRQNETRNVQKNVVSQSEDLMTCSEYFSWE